MNIFEGILLGAIQGLTEFIPVSSSGHLILAREFLNINHYPGLAFDAVLHLATTLAILIYFWTDLKEVFFAFFRWIGRKSDSKESDILMKALMLGTIPTAIVAFIFEDFITEGIRNPIVVSMALIVGSVVFWLAERVGKQNSGLSVKKGFWTGLFQISALIPGVSRSGITISGGMFVGLTREKATRFSFLLAFPIILGSGLKKFYDLSSAGFLSELGPSLIVGSIVAFIFGLLSIHWMIQYLKNHSLNAFAIYRILLAIIVLILVL